MALEGRSRSSAEVIDYFQSFLVNFNHSGEHGHADQRAASDVHGFIHVSEDAPLKIGDIALWHGTGKRRWELGWVVEIQRRHDLWIEYHVQNVFDGSIVWLSDNGIAFLERRRHQQNWPWSDRQHALQARWKSTKTQPDEKSDQKVVPFYITFSREWEVMLRATGEIGNIRKNYDQTFPDWRKVTKAQMRGFLAECQVNHLATALKEGRRGKSRSG